MGRKSTKYELGNIGDIIVQKDNFTGNVYKRKGSISTVETPDKVIKSARSFVTQERAYRALEGYKELGLPGNPSSPSSIFRKVLAHHIDEGNVPHPWVSLPDDTSFDSSGACWLWIERAVPKDIGITGPVYHSDINEAFWSATREGLPIKFFPYDRRDENYVARCIIKSAEKELPYFFQKSLEKDRECLLTGKDIRYFGLEVELLDALSYADDHVDLTPVYETISKHFGPWIQKRARQQSWGTFVMKDGGVTGVRYEDGNSKKTWKIKNRFKNRLWGIIITRRIIRKVHREMTEREGLSCFVDSVLSLEKVETGPDVGEWRNEGTYENGVYIKTPGIWDTLPKSTKKPSSKWKRHSGIKTAPKEEEKERKLVISTGKEEYDPNEYDEHGIEKEPLPEPVDKLPWETGFHKYNGKPGIESDPFVPEDDRLAPNKMPTNPEKVYNALNV